MTRRSVGSVVHYFRLARVTSVVLGNCGFGFAPVKPDFRDRSMLTMTRTEAIPYESMKTRH